MEPLIAEERYSRGWPLASYWGLWLAATVLFLGGTLFTLVDLWRGFYGPGAKLFGLAFLAIHSAFFLVLLRRWLSLYYPWVPLFLFFADVLFGLFARLLRLP